MNATADRILDVGQGLIQTGGFSAMSFQDIASEVGIRKPSIIHHLRRELASGSNIGAVNTENPTISSQWKRVGLIIDKLPNVR